jgi:hypothetical protein
MSPLQRLLDAAELQGLKKPSEICARLKVTQQTFFNWRARNHLPEKEWVRAADAFRLSLDYLVLGRGEPQAADTLTERERAAVEALRCLIEPQQERAVEELVKLAEINWQIAETLFATKPNRTGSLVASSRQQPTPPPSKTPAATSAPKRKSVRR